jgi:hypothetical protein
MMTRELQAALADEFSPLQDEITPFCMRRLDSAHEHWSKRFGRWRESERLYRAYRVPDEQDQRTKTASLTEGVEKIVIPYSYATLQSILAFFMSILTERQPIIPVRGDGPWDVTPAQNMEAILHYQMENMMPCGSLIIFQWLLDAWRYGVGIVKNMYTVREWVDLIRTFSSDPLTGQMVDQLVETDVTAYEGNEAMNVSPFDWYPDPGRPMSEFQRGEFVFHEMRRSWTDMQQREAEGLYVGVDLVKKGYTGVGSRGDSTGSRDNSDIGRIVGMDTSGSDDGDLGRGGGGGRERNYITLHEGWV